MSGIQILDLVIGVVFVYFLLSLICVSLQEMRARIYNLRSKNLEKWILNNFSAEGLGKRLWDNFLVDALTQTGKTSSYISRTVFVNAILDEVHYAPTADETKALPIKEKGKKYLARAPYEFDSLKKSISESPMLDENMRRVLLQMHSESFMNLESFKEKIGNWFDQAMERNAGTFKRDAQTWVLIFSLTVTVLMNVDSIKLVKYFYEHPEASKQVADDAADMVKDQQLSKKLEEFKTNADSAMSADIDTIKANIQEMLKYKDRIEALSLPMGWTNKVIYESDDAYGCILYWFKTLLGWIITGLAVSLGAPFWFDTLNKLVDLRSAGKNPDSAKANGSGKGSEGEPTLG